DKTRTDMADNLRKAVTSLTEVVFPASRSAREGQQHHALRAGTEYVTNLPLQMALYFNVFYFPLWLISSIITLEAKYTALTTLYRIIIIAALVVMTMVELIRLYLGYLGNLTEKVPELAGFWLLTLLLQLPLVLFLLFNEATIILPLERAMNIVMSLFVLFEVIIGYFAIQIMVNHQVAKFHLQQFHNLENIGAHEGHEFEDNTNHTA
ncbi:unnamed protein product, partial [Owenia fusiformis]